MQQAPGPRQAVALIARQSNVRARARAGAWSHLLAQQQIPNRSRFKFSDVNQAASIVADGHELIASLLRSTGNLSAGARARGTEQTRDSLLRHLDHARLCGGAVDLERPHDLPRTPTITTRSGGTRPQRLPSLNIFEPSKCSRTRL
eukprot:Tamp_18232.p1 GENE.Tamp_18232~~Tamp_18232.p1  ORF type:complete len:146 (+),score=7.77 Tamp_18232:749-1186(+)